jgi:hypothetical protein
MDGTVQLHRRHAAVLYRLAVTNPNRADALLQILHAMEHESRADVLSRPAADAHDAPLQPHWPGGSDGGSGL